MGATDVIRAGVALLLLWGATTPALAAPWTVVAAQSRIGFTATWLGKPVVGAFKKWSAAIDFDPATPASAKIDVTVDLASAATGDQTVDGSLPGDDWFAAKTGGQGRFVAAKVVAAGLGHFVATGTLAMRGKAVPVTLPFDLAIAGNTATMTGRVQLDRRAWKLGIESDATAEYVAFAVPVSIRVVAQRRK